MIRYIDPFYIHRDGINAGWKDCPKIIPKPEVSSKANKDLENRLEDEMKKNRKLEETIKELKKIVIDQKEDSEDEDENTPVPTLHVSSPVETSGLEIEEGSMKEAFKEIDRRMNSILSTIDRTNTLHKEILSKEVSNDEEEKKNSETKISKKKHQIPQLTQKEKQPITGPPPLKKVSGKEEAKKWK